MEITDSEDVMMKNDLVTGSLRLENLGALENFGEMFWLYYYPRRFTDHQYRERYDDTRVVL